ncbi:MAG: hypothetical protein JO034_12295 [Singulisphaera sp.]|nr:hypothetical protein [Singulisphaera sp.]
MCIDHETKLTFTGPVYEAVLEVRMASSSDEDQTNLGYQLRTTPAVPGTSNPFGGAYSSTSCHEIDVCAAIWDKCQRSDKVAVAIIPSGSALSVRPSAKRMRH